MKKLNVIDLFAGAGGLSEGFLQTGKFNLIAHVEWETPMVETLRNNLIKRWGFTNDEVLKSVILFDIQKVEELIEGNWSEESKKKYGSLNHDFIINNGIKGLVGDEKVDVIIGGPPCQAYSIAGRAQDPFSMRNDYRNYLFESFAKVVDYFRPKVFVFENVPGMLNAKPGNKLAIERIYDAFNEIGYEIRTPKNMPKSVYSSADYQVPQERRRVIIFGVNKDNSDFKLEDFYISLDNLKSNEPKKTVRDSIGDMPKFKPLEKPYKIGRANVSHELVGDVKIPLHEARYNALREINVFKEWVKRNMNEYPNSEKLAFYERVTGKKTNHNKYRSLKWDKPSPTIVSHLSKDGYMFIHPDEEQGRSITMREAALLQTFPIEYEFLGSNSYIFKMIGNAVPVLFAKNIALAVASVLERKE